MEFSKGMVVRHSTLGIGRIVELEPTAVHVFFVGGERREASKLRLPAARDFLVPDPKARRAPGRAPGVRAGPDLGALRARAGSRRRVAAKGQKMNDQFRGLKERMRRLDAVLAQQGASEDVGFAQALPSLHCAEGFGHKVVLE